MPARTATAAHPHPAGQAAVTPESPRARTVGFVAAATTFVVVFVAGSMPIPLYGTYRSADGVTDTDLSLAAVAYFVLAVTGLVVLGRLSNHFGRRPVALAAVAVALTGSLVFLDLHSPGVLILGRALQGLAAGLASSAVASWAVDTAPREPRWLVATVTTASATIGLSIGAFASGLLVELAPWPRQTPFVVAAALLAACGVLVLLGPETVARTRGAWASLRPQLRLPPATRPFVPAAAAVFLSTWAIGGYVVSFGPSVAVDDLHSTNAVVAAAVFAAYMAPGVLAGPLAGRLRPSVAQRLGMTLVATGVSGMTASVAAGTAAGFLTAALVAGFGMGLATAGSMRALLPQVTSTERAGLLSLVYAASYLGAALPSLVAGQLARSVSLLQITAGYAALVIVALALVLARARDPRPTTLDN